MSSAAAAGRRGEGAALAALALLVLSLSVAPISNNDIFLHLRTGRIILETGRVPVIDDYSALARGRPYVAHEWLAAVLFRIAEAAGGLDALIALKAAVGLLLAAILYRAACLLGAVPAVAVPALTLVMFLAGARIMERPHIFSYLLTAAVLLLVARRRRGSGAPPLLALPALQAVWANLHGGFFLGPLLVGLAAAGEAIEAVFIRVAARRHMREAATLAGVGLLMLFACLLNPYGARLLAFPFELTGSSFMRENYEWLPPFGSEFSQTYMMREYLLWSAFGIAVLAGSLVRAVRRGEAPPGGVFSFLVFGVFLAMSLRMQRSVTDFALATLPSIAACASWTLRPEAAPVARSLAPPRRSPLPIYAAAILLLAGWIGWTGYPYRPGGRRETGVGVARNIPVAAADYLEANGIRGRSFNTYAAGAYLVYRFYPEVRVGMDSRNDVYGPDLYHEYLQALGEPEALRRMLARLDASFAFLEWTYEPAMRALASFRQIGGWRVVYFDDSIVTLLREDGPWAGVAARDAYADLEPSLYSRTLPHLENPARALEEASRAVAASQGAAIARVMRVNALLALGRAGEADEEERRLLDRHPPLHYIYTFLGIIHQAAGDPARAMERFRQALQIDPRDRTALEGLQRLSGR